jgi:sulfur carrier protein
MNPTETHSIGITVNGEARAVPSGLNVLQLLEYLEVDPQRVAIEIDRAIVRKNEWPATGVREGAEIEVVWFVGGGRR